MAFLMPSIRFFFGLPRVLFCFGIHFNDILGNLSSAILWTWPYHASWFCSISFIIGSSNLVCCLIFAFLILSFLDILENLLFKIIYIYIYIYILYILYYSVIIGSLSPRHDASSGCGWRIGLRYGGQLTIY